MSKCKYAEHGRDSCNGSLIVYRAKEGHPTCFLKVMHYALFATSSTVREYMFSNGIDKNVVQLNDLKFFKSVIYILVSVHHHYTADESFNVSI